MSNVNAHKNFTACNDAEAEKLLQEVLAETAKTLDGTELCVLLGGSYGRGEGGVRSDRENGILYNDLDFFVFARKSSPNDTALLKKIAEKYEKELKIDVDFSRIMSIRDIKNNASRLMMQELKRGYRLVAGEDLLKKYLPERPAEELPFSEACRLLLNRGMGLLLAGEKISENSADTDFILRNINKAILGACDAIMIAEKNYRWKIAERLDAVNNSDLPDEYKKRYRTAVEFKQNPCRNITENITELHKQVCAMFIECTKRTADGNADDICKKCRNNGETSLKNYLKYCFRSKSIPILNFHKYTVPATVFMLTDLYNFLRNDNYIIDRNGDLYKHWLIFN